MTFGTSAIAPGCFFNQQHMKVELEYIGKQSGYTAAQTMAYFARVSNPANQHNHDTAPKLLRYLYTQKHWSPFEMVDMVLYIETSRAISAQIMRHRSFSFQEFSQRYSDVLGFEPIELRAQAEKNRQSSTGPYTPTPEMLQRIFDLLGEARQVYEELIDDGCSRETARFLLPECTQTRLYMKGSIRSWIHYIQVRTHETTQQEHRAIAVEAKRILLSEIPELEELIG